MRRATKRRFLRLLLVGTLIGVAYGGFIGRTFRGTALIGSLVGAIDGATITAAIAAIEIFLLRTRWDRPLQQASFLVTFGVKWLAYGMVITAVNERSPARGCSARPWVPPRSRGSSCWGYPFPVLLGSSG